MSERNKDKDRLVAVTRHDVPGNLLNIITSLTSEVQEMTVAARNVADTFAGPSPVSGEIDDAPESTDQYVFVRSLLGLERELMALRRELERFDDHCPDLFQPRIPQHEPTETYHGQEAEG